MCVQVLPDEEPPQRPGEDEEDPKEPALGDDEGNGHGDGVRVVFDHNKELRHGDGCHQPSLLAELFVELPEGENRILGGIEWADKYENALTCTQGALF